MVPSEIFNNNKFYPYFRVITCPLNYNFTTTMCMVSMKYKIYCYDCVCVINGTHIHVKVSSVETPRYRWRKEYSTQNMLTTCTFDLKFTYVLHGWEGSASYLRIIKNASTRVAPLKEGTCRYVIILYKTPYICTQFNNKVCFIFRKIFPC